MKKFKVGLQLFSIREDLEKDMGAALKKVKEIGYDYVEFAGYYGKTAAEVRALLDENGLKCVSVHQDPRLFVEQGQAAADFLKEIGASYAAVPYWPIDQLNTPETWVASKKMFTEVATLLKENGIQALYHNHDFEFEKVDGEFILDRIYREIPGSLLQPEIDTCWVNYAGQNPVDYIMKYSGRIDIVHLKDFVCTKLGGGPVYDLIGKDGGTTTSSTASLEENGFEFRPVGSGVQDMPAILEACEKAGAEIVIVEQDMPFGMTAMESAAKSREYLKSLGI